MRLRYLVTMGALLAAVGCGDRSLNFSPGLGDGSAGGPGTTDGGGSGGAGGNTKPDVGVCTGAVCDIACPYGLAADPNGCPLCKCNQAPTCPARQCKTCPNGYIQDANGCDTCECRPIACPRIACPEIACSNGFATDPNGCPTCRCNPAPMCKPIACPPIACPYGNQVDPAGCPTCACNPAPTCAPLACRLYCPYGYQKDPNGCPVCACNPQTCAPEECALGGAVDLPAPACPDGGARPTPVCERNAMGVCSWTYGQCPSDCGRVYDPASCSRLTSCVWLQPGCTAPSIPTAGCYPREYLGCGEKMYVCPGGRVCQKRTINPCAQPYYGGGSGSGPSVGTGGSSGGMTVPADPVAPVPVPACEACAQAVTICL
jgi:hypothetical protein